MSTTNKPANVKLDSYACFNFKVSVFLCSCLFYHIISNFVTIYPINFVSSQKIWQLAECRGHWDYAKLVQRFLHMLQNHFCLCFLLCSISKTQASEVQPDDVNIIIYILALFKKKHIPSGCSYKTWGDVSP